MTERTAEEWGRVAVSLLGWRWWWEHDKRRPYGLPGYCRRLGRGPWVWVPDVSECAMADEIIPDPDDPATAGCLLALLGPNLTAYDFGSYADEPGENGLRFRVVLYGDNKGKPKSWPPVDCATLGRACIAAAEAIGRWPGGE